MYNSYSDRPPLVSIIFTFSVLFCLIFIILYPIVLMSIPSPQDENLGKYISENKDAKISIPKSRHYLCVVVPYRDRWAQLSVFVPYLSEFLSNQLTRHSIYIINQADRYRFNRGALINVGFLYGHPDCDYFALHDIDLLPNSPLIEYIYPNSSGPIHLTAPKYHPFYNFDSYFGGVTLIRREHFERANGFSNKFWGWGLEDDEFRLRITEKGLNISMLSLPLNRKNAFIHISVPNAKGSRDSKNWLESARRKRDRHYGYRDVQLSSLPRITTLSVENYNYIQVDVKLSCNVTSTPWCMSEAYL